ncbi:uncharacterized protein LOC144445703 [Glandiceps talaboti]
MSSDHDDKYEGKVDTAQLCKAFKAQSLEDKFVNDDGDNSRPVSHYTRLSGEDCSQYKFGVCEQDNCTKIHKVLHYPSGSHWDKMHVNSLRLDFVPLGMDAHVTSAVLKEWLVSSPSRADAMLGSRSGVLFAAATSATWNGQMVDNDGLSRHLENDNDDNKLFQDPFLDTLVKFWHDSNLNKEQDKQSLHLLAQKANKSEYRLVLYRWITVLKDSKVSECTLDDLIVEVVRVASKRTDIDLVINVRESTGRKMTICGKELGVQSNIEVCGISGKGVLQVLTCTENKVITKKAHVRKEQPWKPSDEAEQFLPQMACEALAIGEDSPFGTAMYKTVYQVSLHVIRNREGKLNDLYVLLTRCHISRDTLKCMSERPLPNPLESSVLLYQRVNFDKINNDAISFIYLAIKAVVMMFKADVDGAI